MSLLGARHAPPQAKVWTTLQCAGQGRGYQCTTTRFNASSICNRMAGPRFLYP